MTELNANYYEAVADVPPDHCLCLQLPSDIPSGPVRVAIIFDSQKNDPWPGDNIKDLLAAMPDVGEDEDFVRPQDFGREGLTWDS